MKVCKGLIDDLRLQVPKTQSYFLSIDNLPQAFPGLVGANPGILFYNTIVRSNCNV